MLSSETQHQIAEAIAAGKMTYTGAAIGTGGWLFSSQFFGVCGLVVAVVGLVMQIYFNRKRDAREQTEHEARMRAMK